MLIPVLKGLADFVWPPRATCLLCEEWVGEGLSPLCHTCSEAMQFPAERRCCSRCLRPTRVSVSCCDECRDRPELGRVWAVGLHEGPLREAIHHLKFNGRAELGVQLGQRLGLSIASRYDAAVPIPLHRHRLRERGYNQALSIATGVCQATGIHLVENGLQRLRSTGHQAKLDRADRLRNLNGAFSISKGWRPEGQRLLLIDDVLTTGATAAAAASVLLAAGAAQVDAGVLAVSATVIGK